MVSNGLRDCLQDQNHAPLVAVVGNIAAGKSTLATLLAAELGWDYSAESVTENPYLAGFYADPTAWTFHLNMYFLGRRAQQVMSAASSGGAVLDRTIYEDRIFVALNVEDGITTAAEEAVFDDLSDALEQLLPRPGVLVHVWAPAETLMSRVQARGRTFESGLTIQHLERLQAGYERWIGSWDACPVIAVDTREFDPHADRHGLVHLAERVKKASSALPPD